MPRLTGPNILKLGEYWKELMVHGKPPVQIADDTGQPLQVVQRAIWLGGWPEHLKDLVFNHPHIFSRSVLINGFASKRRQCEKNKFALLEKEMRRMLEEGSSSQPKLRRTNKKRREVRGTKASPLFHVDKAVEAEWHIKQSLGLHNRVVFEQNGSGEVRLFFSDEKDLNFILERIQDPATFQKTQSRAQDEGFWDLLKI